VNIEKTFSHSLKKFYVVDKKFAITLDNAYNNDNFFLVFFPVTEPPILPAAELAALRRACRTAKSGPCSNRNLAP
jgi:hypothetical protein